MVHRHCRRRPFNGCYFLSSPNWFRVSPYLGRRGLYIVYVCLHNQMVPVPSFENHDYTKRQYTKVYCLLITQTDKEEYACLLSVM